MAVLITDGDSVAEIVPERGALVSRFDVGGEPLLFMDASTLADPGKNVRGGIPVLFPSPGVIPGGKYPVEGSDYPMRRHGFARDLAWEVRTRERSRVILTLGPSEQTLREFPWRFEARLTVTIEREALRLTFAAENRDSRPMPLHLGYHPYFHVPQANKAATRVDAQATRAWDNRTQAAVPYTGLDLTGPEVDMHLLDPSRPGTTLTRGPGLRPVQLSWSPSFKTIVVWTLSGRDFVCVEPWTAPSGALRTGEGLLHVAPGDTFSSDFEIRAGPR
ncbi:aldose epimerase [Melittangium boletus]|uniref:Aldose 1-epimerase n=1 Tax=Melittangium boletus DSM 14713 TaxID=1294270 RepID=A0A250IBH9_9BACT|nr:aldose epimerase [Melittangium boletus]ATB28593.1 aldose 1-epimerase [Melittangium boletus DSM 14713]